MVSGFSIVTSQRYGAGDLKGVRQSVTNGLYLSLIIAALITIVGLAFMRPLLVLMNTPEEIFDYALTYISTICAGIVCVIMYNFCASLMRAVGNSLMPLIFLICSAATNIGLDIWFIVGFRMGTFGAALATVVSQGLAVIPCVIFIYTKMPTLRPSKEDWKWNSAIIKEELKYGIPMAIQYGITASGTVIMQSAFNTFDYIAVGAITAASKFQGIITMGMFSVGQTMAAYAGQNYGAKNLTRIKQGVKAALKLYVVYSAVAAVISIITVPKILWIFFDSDVDISLYIPWAMPYVIECAVCYFFLAMIFIYRHTIQSVGYAQLAMILGFVELGARIITSFCSIKLHNYYIAVASDPFAWVLAGVCGLFISVVIFKKIEKRWAEEKSPAQVQNGN